MSELISYDEAIILYKHGIDVIMAQKGREPEHWQPFSPCCKKGWVFKKKFKTIELQVSSATPLNMQNCDEFYVLQTMVQKCKKIDGGFKAIEDLTRYRFIGAFKTHEQADELALSLAVACGKVTK